MPENHSPSANCWEKHWVHGKEIELFRPESGSRLVAVYLHSFQCETLANRPVWIEQFHRLRLACAFLNAGRSWWTNRICREFDAQFSPEEFLVHFLAPWLRDRHASSARGIGLVGVDMGGQGALRIAFRHPELFPVVAAIGPSIEYHELYWSGLSIDEMYSSKEECRQDTALMHVNPFHYPPHIFFATDPTDPWWRGSDRLREKLTALGVPHTCDLNTRGGGHSWAFFDAVAPRAIEFLRQGLEQVSRRLV